MYVKFKEESNFSILGLGYDGMEAIFQKGNLYRILKEDEDSYYISSKYAHGAPPLQKRMARRHKYFWSVIPKNDPRIVTVQKVISLEETKPSIEESMQQILILKQYLSYE